MPLDLKKIYEKCICLVKNTFFGANKYINIQLFIKKLNKMLEMSIRVDDWQNDM